METKDREHVAAILAEYPLSVEEFAHLEAEMPHRTGTVTEERRLRFEAGLQELRALVARSR